MIDLAVFDWRARDENAQSTSLAILLPVIVCAATLLFAAITVFAARIDAWPLLSTFDCAIVSLLCVLSFNFLDVAWLARSRADNPLSKIKERLVERLPLMILPAFVLPTFLIGYTASKCAIPFLVGYTWDHFWANVDRAIFGDDAWRLALGAIGTSTIHVWTWVYSVGWGTAFLVVANAVAWYGKRELIGVYFTASLATWLIGGCFMAYALSAAGPVFAPMFDPSLASRFRPLQDFLNTSLGYGPIGFSQHFLAVAVHQHVASKGGGISAMPSMHIASVSIFVLAARRTRWVCPAILFWLMIFVLSAYFGFHYWIDGIVAAIVSAICWFGSEILYSRLLGHSNRFIGQPQLLTS